MMNNPLKAPLFNIIVLDIKFRAWIFAGINIQVRIMNIHDNMRIITPWDSGGWKVVQDLEEQKNNKVTTLGISRRFWSEMAP